MANRERGYNALGLFTPPEIWKFLAFDVTSIEIQNDTDAFPHTYHGARPTANASMILLVVRK